MVGAAAQVQNVELHRFGRGGSQPADERRHAVGVDQPVDRLAEGLGEGTVEHSPGLRTRADQAQTVGFQRYEMAVRLDAAGNVNGFARAGVEVKAARHGLGPWFRSGCRRHDRPLLVSVSVRQARSIQAIVTRVCRIPVESSTAV